MAEFNSPVDIEAPLECTLLVDRALNVKGSGAWIVLEDLGDILIEQTLKFEFRASNN